MKDGCCLGEFRDKSNLVFWNCRDQDSKNTRRTSSIFNISSLYKIIWIVRALWLVYKCVFIALWRTKMTWAIWLVVSKLWEFTVSWKELTYTCVLRISSFSLLRTVTNNFSKRSKTCSPCLHSLLNTSTKFVRILELVKSLDCVSVFTDVFSNSFKRSLWFSPDFKGTGNIF